MSECNHKAATAEALSLHGMDENDKAAKDNEEEEDELHGKSRSSLVSENRPKGSDVNSVPTTKQPTAKQTEPFDCSDSEMNSKELSVSASPDKKLVPNKHIEHASTMSSLDSSALDDEKELFADDERAEQKKCLWWKLLEDLQLNRMLLYNMLSSWNGVLEEASVARAYCDQLISTLSSHEKQVPPEKDLLMDDRKKNETHIDLQNGLYKKNGKFIMKNPFVERWGKKDDYASPKHEQNSSHVPKSWNTTSRVARSDEENWSSASFSSADQNMVSALFTATSSDAVEAVGKEPSTQDWSTPETETIWNDNAMCERRNKQSHFSKGRKHISSALFPNDFRGMQKERIWKCLVQEQNFDNEILYNLLLLWDKSILSSESVIEAYRRSLKELNISNDALMSILMNVEGLNMALDCV
ncbi:unnamed protein product [Gongylonema pulchrum]|uniref:Rab-GAP TBC domain-containing protein n=1 Tax=Gongylonema pulchrum TaxID=637853 RepID=A0A183E103_9BILA|nr:unnamed protein product [Gongylonema pulchrum]